MSSTIVWLVIFVIATFLALVWAAKELAVGKIYHHNNINYPHELEFNSSFVILFTIIVTIITSVLVGIFIEKYIQPSETGGPNIATTIGVVVLWVIAMLINIPLFMKAKVIHVSWPPSYTETLKYPVTIGFNIAFATLLTISLATMGSTVVGALIAHVVSQF